MEYLSDDEEVAEIVILPLENTGEVTDEKNNKYKDDNGMCEVSGEIEVHIQKL